MKFLMALLTLANRLLAMWSDHKQQQRGRQDAQKEAEDELQRQVELAEHAVVTIDPDRTERLRSRFDAASS